jgi:hypothetical protein
MKDPKGLILSFIYDQSLLTYLCSSRMSLQRAARTLGGERIEAFFVGCECQHRFSTVLPDFYP